MNNIEKLESVLNQIGSLTMSVNEIIKEAQDSGDIERLNTILSPIHGINGRMYIYCMEPGESVVKYIEKDSGNTDMSDKSDINIESQPEVDKCKCSDGNNSDHCCNKNNKVNGFLADMDFSLLHYYLKEISGTLQQLVTTVNDIKKNTEPVDLESCTANVLTVPVPEMSAFDLQLMTAFIDARIKDAIKERDKKTKKTSHIDDK